MRVRLLCETVPGIKSIPTKGMIAEADERPSFDEGISITRDWGTRDGEIILTRTFYFGPDDYEEYDEAAEETEPTAEDLAGARSWLESLTQEMRDG